MAFKPSQPQSIGGVLDIGFQVYKTSVAQIWPICILIAIGTLAPSLYMLFKVGSFAQSAPTEALAYMKQLFLDPVYWLCYLLSMAISSWAMGAIYLKQDAIASGTDLTLGQALALALRRTPSLVLAAILFMIAVAIGCVLLLIPGLILMVSLMLFGAVVTLEARGPAGGLMRSHKLVWGHWWRTTAVLTVAFIIVVVIYAAIGFVVALILPFAARNLDPLVFSLINSTVLNVVIQVLVLPFFLGLMLSLYWDLRLRRDGGDLSDRLNALNPA